VSSILTPGGTKPRKLAKTEVTFTGSGEEAKLIVNGLRSLEAGIKMFDCIGTGRSEFGAVSLDEVQKLLGQISVEKFAERESQTSEEILDNLERELKEKQNL
jgi:hypothetical protein